MSPMAPCSSRREDKGNWPSTSSPEIVELLAKHKTRIAEDHMKADVPTEAPYEPYI